MLGLYIWQMRQAWSVPLVTKHVTLKPLCWIPNFDSGNLCLLDTSSDVVEFKRGLARLSSDPLSLVVSD